MDYPFVAVDARGRYWPCHDLFVTTPINRQFNNSKPNLRFGTKGET
jgi:hypothetical protein